MLISETLFNLINHHCASVALFMWQLVLLDHICGVGRSGEACFFLFLSLCLSVLPQVVSHLDNV